MILRSEDFPRYVGQVCLIDGAFDPLHAGHLAYIQAARGFADNHRLQVCCSVAPDRYVQTKHTLLIPEDQRILIMDALRDIDYTHLTEIDTATVLKQLRPFAYLKGRDWKDKLPTDQRAICQHYGIRLVFVDTVIESSTRLLELRDAAVTDPTRSARSPRPAPRSP